MINQEQKLKLISLLTERIKSAEFEWRVTDNYIYIGSKSATCIITQNLLDDIKEICEWQYNVVGGGHVVLAVNFMGVEPSYLDNRQVCKYKETGITGQGTLN
jgi:hypothetical protein